MKECLKCQSCYEDVLLECPADQSPLREGLPGPTTLAGKFRLEVRLGKGGMGAVYRAMHLGLKRYVALKTLSPRNRSHSEFSERFRREAEAAGRIKHPNVIDVMDFGFAEVGKHHIGYLAMEYLEGCSLRDLLKEQPKLSLTETVKIIKDVCEAIELAHSLGVIHRDLKPDNIWLADHPKGGYLVKVLDFGIAKLAYREQTESASASLAISRQPAFSSTIDESATNQDSDSITGLTADGPASQTKESEARSTENINAATELFRATVEHLTQSGAMIGTIPYMSPEQCNGEPCTSASDIYSLGVIAFEMLTGRRPFIGKSFEIALQHISEEPPPPS
ncbi:MAG: serine/threonine-protein kinase, partial [Acidobacteriota bacterium]